MIETNRLKLYAASQGEMETFIEAQTVDVLKAAYTEMLNGCLNHPDQWDWYAIWMFELKDGTHIGELCFKGLSADGIAEIGYGISDQYQNNGYAAEAVRAVLEWAFSHPEVIAVEAETVPDNIASKRVLEKCGFALNGIIGEEGPRWAVRKC
jgi:RimJ/RimL family protein N-acetyltransferase